MTSGRQHKRRTVDRPASWVTALPPCPWTGKRSLPDRGSAKQALARLRGGGRDITGLQVYRCHYDECRLFHLGNKGEQTREEHRAAAVAARAEALGGVGTTD